MLLIPSVLCIAVSLQYAVRDHRLRATHLLTTTTPFSSRPNGEPLNREFTNGLLDQEQPAAPNSDTHVHSQEGNLIELTRTTRDPLAGRQALQSRTQISRVSCDLSQKQILTEIIAKVADISKLAHNASKREWLFDPKNGQDRENFFEIFRTLDWSKLKKAVNYYSGVYRETVGGNTGTILISCHESFFCSRDPNLIINISPRSNFIIMVWYSDPQPLARSKIAAVPEILDVAYDQRHESHERRSS